MQYAELEEGFFFPIAPWSTVRSTTFFFLRVDKHDGITGKFLERIKHKVAVLVFFETREFRHDQLNLCGWY